MRRLRIFTWPVHGSYMYYLSHARHDFFVPNSSGERDPNWPANMHAVPVDHVRHEQFDCILFQARTHYLEEQYAILSAEQQRLPRVYVEHDPPREHPTDTRHVVDDPGVLLVHVTHFNRLMWDNGDTPTRVIEHGVVVPPDVRYTGELERGLVVINNLGSRGRRLGADVFAHVRERVPLDLIGMGATELGGLGEVKLPQLPAFAARYRFFFNPIRYTSLGLAVCEAMLVGLPIVGLATTEMVTVIENGVNGYVDTDVNKLIDRMQALLHDPPEAQRLGANARRYAQDRFNIQRFARDWEDAFAYVTG
jgi:glycosyltransferase involved in cell wall biosynthesis